MSRQQMSSKTSGGRKLKSGDRRVQAEMKNRVESMRCAIQTRLLDKEQLHQEFTVNKEKSEMIRNINKIQTRTTGNSIAGEPPGGPDDTTHHQSDYFQGGTAISEKRLQRWRATEKQVAKECALFRQEMEPLPWYRDEPKLCGQSFQIVMSWLGYEAEGIEDMIAKTVHSNQMDIAGDIAQKSQLDVFQSLRNPYKETEKRQRLLRKRGEVTDNSKTFSIKDWEQDLIKNYTNAITTPSRYSANSRRAHSAPVHPRRDVNSDSENSNVNPKLPNKRQAKPIIRPQSAFTLGSRRKHDKASNGNDLNPRRKTLQSCDTDLASALAKIDECTTHSDETESLGSENKNGNSQDHMTVRESEGNNTKHSDICNGDDEGDIKCFCNDDTSPSKGKNVENRYKVENEVDQTDRVIAVISEDDTDGNQTTPDSRTSEHANGGRRRSAFNFPDTKRRTSLQLLASRHGSVPATLTKLNGHSQQRRASSVQPNTLSSIPSRRGSTPSCHQRRVSMASTPQFYHANRRVSMPVTPTTTSLLSPSIHTSSDDECENVNSPVKRTRDLLTNPMNRGRIKSRTTSESSVTSNEDLVKSPQHDVTLPHWKRDLLREAPPGIAGVKDAPKVHLAMSKSQRRRDLDSLVDENVADVKQLCEREHTRRLQSRVNVVMTMLKLQKAVGNLSNVPEEEARGDGVRRRRESSLGDDVGVRVRRESVIAEGGLNRRTSVFSEERDTLEEGGEGGRRRRKSILGDGIGIRVRRESVIGEGGLNSSGVGEQMRVRRESIVGEGRSTRLESMVGNDHSAIFRRNSVECEGSDNERENGVEDSPRARRSVLRGRITSESSIPENDNESDI